MLCFFTTCWLESFLYGQEVEIDEPYEYEGYYVTAEEYKEIFEGHKMNRTPI